MAAYNFYHALYQAFDFDSEDTSHELEVAITGGRRVFYNAFIVNKTASWTPDYTTEFGADYTYTSGSGGNCTLPADSVEAFPVGYELDVYTRGAGVVTFVQGAGATVNGFPDLIGTAQYSRAKCKKLAANTWQVNWGT